MNTLRRAAHLHDGIIIRRCGIRTVGYCIGCIGEGTVVPPQLTPPALAKGSHSVRGATTMNHTVLTTARINNDSCACTLPPSAVKSTIGKAVSRGDSSTEYYSTRGSEAARGAGTMLGLEGDVCNLSTRGQGVVWWRSGTALDQAT